MIDYLQPLIAKSIVRNFSANSTILYQGEVPQSACVLLRGVVRVFSISKQGDEQIVTFHVAGEFFPSSWIFKKSISTVFFYDALTDCEVAFIPRDELVEFMFSQSDRVRSMLDYFITNYSAFLIRVNGLEQPKARDKLIYTLYYLCQRYGDHRQKTSVHIPIALTHQHLAGLVGLTRETTAMEMNKLKRQRVITYKQQKYIVEQEKLLELIGEDSLRDISIAG